MEFNQEVYLAVVFIIAAIIKTIMVLGYRTSQIPLLSLHSVYQFLAVGLSFQAFGLWVMLCVIGVMAYLNLIISYLLQQRGNNYGR